MKILKNMLALAVAGAASVGAHATTTVTSTSFAENFGGYSGTGSTNVNFTNVRRWTTSSTNLNGWDVNAQTTEVGAAWLVNEASSSGTLATPVSSVSFLGDDAAYLSLSGATNNFGVVTLNYSLTLAAGWYDISFNTYSTDAGVTITSSFGSQTEDLASSSTGWVTQSFKAYSDGSASTLTFVSLSNATIVGIDDISVVAGTAPVPEPETYALFALGLAAVGAARKRSKRA
ncbi:PEP-CTERM sorting domain-containing protein [Ideonella livida]|uniref:PEP-CTERM sorting domain-containing protein n=1 Tax=Ideonella livida TaxID=2707176 RepID=A0A7C9TL15_9BURK|nr:PEP-CTERM sorting domain-containing protein [Ideonella livida]NDY91287.1 PEP-CTERM sorting domain-containing protein [Ideonella livida]